MKNDYNRFDFWISKDNNNIFYYMRINGQWLQVSKQVYSICRNSYRKVNRDNERDKDIVLHYDNVELAQPYATDDKEHNLIDLIQRKTYAQKLHIIMKYLTNDEKAILNEIYFNNKTERETAIILHMPFTTLHNKKIRILKKLKSLLEQDTF